MPSRPVSQQPQGMTQGAGTQSIGAGCLAIIIARGGSKGLSRKNVRELAGKPLIGWTIEAALGCSAIGRVVVSTEDAEIARIARRFGAEVPFERPSELAGDDVPGLESVIHAVEWIQAHGTDQAAYEYIVVLQPTSPLRRAEDIDAVLQLARRRDADGVISVTPVTKHPEWMMEVTEDGQVRSCSPPNQATLRRQELPVRYVPNGAIYLTRREVLLQRRSFTPERTYGYIMPPERSLDIDTAWDFQLADLILRQAIH